MGTNYYADNGTHRLHVGKSSCGWTFSFQGYSRENGDTCNIKSFKEWKVYIQATNSKIFNEYDEEVDLKWFLELISEKQKKPDNMRHYDYVVDKTKQPDKFYSSHADDCFLDPEGYSFSYGYFS